METGLTAQYLRVEVVRLVHEVLDEVKMVRTRRQVDGAPAVVVLHMRKCRSKFNQMYPVLMNE